MFSLTFTFFLVQRLESDAVTPEIWSYVRLKTYKKDSWLQTIINVELAEVQEFTSATTSFRLNSQTKKRVKNFLKNKNGSYYLSTTGKYQLSGPLPKCFPDYGFACKESLVTFRKSKIFSGTSDGRSDIGFQLEIAHFQIFRSPSHVPHAFTSPGSDLLQGVVDMTEQRYI
ncbi:hypothetical protein J6590_016644 [Homalodisca vitripennis]|nr:hypothetical protein J6590_016644 [Homalodisca vitripennis]